MAGLARAALLAAATVAASPPIRVAVVVRLGLWLGLALGQVRVMVRVRVSSVPPRREHSGVPPCSKCTPLPAAYPLPRSRSAIGYIKTPVDGSTY